MLSRSILKKCKNKVDNQYPVTLEIRAVSARWNYTHRSSLKHCSWINSGIRIPWKFLWGSAIRWNEIRVSSGYWKWKIKNIGKEREVLHVHIGTTVIYNIQWHLGHCTWNSFNITKGQTVFQCGPEFLTAGNKWYIENQMFTCKSRIISFPWNLFSKTSSGKWSESIIICQYL